MKKWMMISSIFIGCILIFIFTLTLVNKRNSIDDLMTQLEKSINSNEIKSMVNLYPDYYQNTVSDILSQDRLNEFNNKIGKIKIHIINQTDYDLSQAKNEQNRIDSNYGINLEIEDYQIVIINVANDVGSVLEQTQLEVIKIRGEYYLYAEYYLGDLIQCFVK